MPEGRLEAIHLMFFRSSKMISPLGGNYKRIVNFSIFIYKISGNLVLFLALENFLKVATKNLGFYKIP